MDLAWEQLVSILSVVSLLSIFQQVTGIELGGVQNESLSFRIYSLGRNPWHVCANDVLGSPTWEISKDWAG